jgi:hypothetical protein
MSPGGGYLFGRHVSGMNYRKMLGEWHARLSAATTAIPDRIARGRYSREPFE